MSVVYIAGVVGVYLAFGVGVAAGFWLAFVFLCYACCSGCCYRH